MIANPSGPSSLGIKTSRTSTGSVAASARAFVTCSWPAPFPDTNYSVVATMNFNRGATATAIRVERIETVNAGSVVVAVINDDAGTAWTGIVEVLAVHD